MSADELQMWSSFWELTKTLYSLPWKCDNIQILFTERRISVAGNFEANSCQLSTLNMGMIRENINIFDINVKPPLTFSICLSLNSILIVLSSAILCSNRSDWLNPVQELFTETGLSSPVKTVQYCDMRQCSAINHRIYRVSQKTEHAILILSIMVKL